MEKEKLKEAEVEAYGLNVYENAMKRMQEFKEKAKKGRKVIHGKNLPWELNRNSIAKHYCGQSIPGNCMENFTMFVHEVRSFGGKHKHQGGFFLFFLRGRGYSVLDGIRNNWKEGDLLLIPFKPGGIEHQHFNSDNRPSRFIAFNNYTLGLLVGPFMEQRALGDQWSQKFEQKQ